MRNYTINEFKYDTRRVIVLGVQTEDNGWVHRPIWISNSKDLHIGEGHFSTSERQINDLMRRESSKVRGVQRVLNFISPERDTYSRLLYLRDALSSASFSFRSILSPIQQIEACKKILQMIIEPVPTALAEYYDMDE